VPFGGVVANASMMFVTAFATSVLRTALGHPVMGQTIVTKPLLFYDLHTRWHILVDFTSKRRVVALTKHTR